MPRELEGASDRRIDRGPVRERRTVKAWRQPGRGGAAAERWQTFEHQRLEARLAQHARRDQPIRPSANDDDSLGHVLSILSQDPSGGVSARRAHDASSRMGRGPAHPEVAQGGLVLRPSWRRTQEEQLFERQLALKDIPFAQTELALEIERRQDLAVTNDAREVRRMFCDRVHDRISKCLALLVPGAVSERVRRVLNKA